LGGLYALGVGQSGRQSQRVHIDAAVPHGTLVHLFAAAGGAQVRCLNVKALDAPVLVP
jgi:hypothetical protein